ncbi:MAG: sigma-54-dependent Fis family transcriptional regulator [Ignavibacteriota bacterium]
MQAVKALRRPVTGVVLACAAGDWRTAELLETARKTSPATPVLMYDPAASPADAVRMARLGACQFLTSDEDTVALLDQLWQESAAWDSAKDEEWERLLVGDGPEMGQVRQIIRVVADRRSTVLITGETGTGKELVARSLHLASQRKRAPWVAVNCSALPENLLEAELFGHVKGAFTGALQNRVGRFEEAQGGTLFLDEIGDLELGLQAKLLRVIQERELQRLGSSEIVRLNVRLVAATNRDLGRRVEQGLFREDLYYRLNVVPIHRPHFVRGAKTSPGWPLTSCRKFVPWKRFHVSGWPRMPPSGSRSTPGPAMSASWRISWRWQWRSAAPESYWTPEISRFPPRFASTNRRRLQVPSSQCPITAWIMSRPWR